MRKILIICIITLALALSSVASYGATSDKQLSENWVNNHGGGYTIEKVITVANGGYKVKVKGTKWIVKYPIKRYHIRLCTKKLSHVLSKVITR